MTSGFVLGPGEGSAYGFHGSVAVIKASGEDTFGQLGVIESVYPAGLSVHEHVHAGEDEMFYLLGGEMEAFCGRTAGPSPWSPVWVWVWVWVWRSMCHSSTRAPFKTVSAYF